MSTKSIDIPRVLIAALRGGSGKTVVSIGIVSALVARGKSVAPFKKGPDYIDAGWLALAAGRPCHNLDAFLCSDEAVCRSVAQHGANADIAVIEGNRGLFDGLDAVGTTSSASLSKLIRSPVVLCMDCTKSTRTMAAVALGCVHFDPEVEIAGVILNRVAGSRHEHILRSCIEQHAGIPVIGAVPKMPSRDFPERHMGLIPTAEHSWAAESIAAARRMAESYIDLSAITRISETAMRHPVSCCEPAESIRLKDECREVGGSAPRPRIGILRDAAFQFYYPENIAALENAGAEPVYISPLESTELPELDAIYIGGGFPETHAARLAENQSFSRAVKSAADCGMPIYAECGGLIYLGETLVLDRNYPMCGVLPIVFGFSSRPQGHGYTILNVNRRNPYFSDKKELRGHEFHYSRVLEWRGRQEDLVFTMKKGRGIIEGRDGISIRNVMATYTHIHALGCPEWAAALVRLARTWRHDHLEN